MRCAFVSLLSVLALAAPVLALESPVVHANPAPAPGLTASEFAVADWVESLLADLQRRSGKAFSPIAKEHAATKLRAMPASQLQAAAVVHDAGFVTNVLGDPSTDLVYNRIAPPCRIFDSRTGSGVQGDGTGPLPAGTKVAIDVAEGLASSCGVPFPLTKAAVLNFVVVAPSGPGDLRAWPWDDTLPPPPNASIINYTAVTGLNIANGLVVPICDTTTSTDHSCMKDLLFQPDVHGAHVVIDVLGYFSQPQATPVSCQQLRTDFSVNGNSLLSAVSPACPSGYALASGGVDFTAAPATAHLLGSSPSRDSPGLWLCTGYNPDPAILWTGSCWSVCCQILGH